MIDFDSFRKFSLQRFLRVNSIEIQYHFLFLFSHQLISSKFYICRSNLQLQIRWLMILLTLLYQYYPPEYLKKTKKKAEIPKKKIDRFTEQFHISIGIDKPIFLLSMN